MKSAILLVALCGLMCAVYGQVDHTHFDNHLNTDIHATTFYDTSKFQNRNIPAGGSAVDEYNFRFNLNFGSDDAGLDIGVFAPRDGRVCCGHIDSDTSVIVVPVMADGNLVPGFTVNINNNGQPGKIVCATDGSGTVGKATCSSTEVLA